VKATSAPTADLKNLSSNWLYCKETYSDDTVILEHKYITDAAKGIITERLAEKPIGATINGAYSNYRKRVDRNNNNKCTY